MTNDDLIKIGFKTIPHFTIANSVIYPLGRHRHLSAGCVGTPNEMLWICETDKQNETKINDLICLHNYDHDGYLSEKKIKSLISAITGTGNDNPVRCSHVFKRTFSKTDLEILSGTISIPSLTTMDVSDDFAGKLQNKLEEIGYSIDYVSLDDMGYISVRYWGRPYPAIITDKHVDDLLTILNEFEQN